MWRTASLLLAVVSLFALAFQAPSSTLNQLPTTSSHDDSLANLEHTISQLYPDIQVWYEPYAEDDSLPFYGYEGSESNTREQVLNIDTTAVINHENYQLITVDWRSTLSGGAPIYHYFFVTIEGELLNVITRPTDRYAQLYVGTGNHRQHDPRIVEFIQIADSVPAVVFEQQGDHAYSGFADAPRYIIAPIDGETRLVHWHYHYKGFLDFSLMDETPDEMAELLNDPSIEDWIPNEMYRDDLHEQRDSMIVSNDKTDGFYNLVVFTDTCSYSNKKVACGSYIDTLRWNKETGTY